MTSSMTLLGQSRSILNLPSLGHSLSYSTETNIFIISGSRDSFLTDSIFGFGLKGRQRSKIEAVFGNFRNPCYLHDCFYLTTDMKPRCQIIRIKPFWLRWDYRWRHSATLNIAFYIHVLERAAPRARSKASNSGINANIIITFLCYKWLR